MSENTEAKIKFGYLSYDEMLTRIDTGELNEYDVIYSKDRLTTFVISEELKPIEIRSRVYVYDSIVEAESALNTAIDTYIGQIVSIKYNDKYRGYIVNQNIKGFYVTPLDKHPDIIDYNTLGNRPIVNLTGTLDIPIVVSELNSGLYLIKGQYTISDDISTVYLSASGALFSVEKTSSAVYIKKITSTEITDYTVTDVTKSYSYITKEFLEENGYTTTSYVDEKNSSRFYY